MNNTGKPGKKARDCPALGRSITPGECGSQRNSRLACPSDCVFNPLGTANRLLTREVEQSWQAKVVLWLQNRLGRDEFEQRMRRWMLGLEDESARFNLALQSTLQHELFLERDAEGRTLADRWEAEGWTGLNNDERVLMGCRRRTLPTLFEVRRFIGEDRCECVDLLEPGAPRFVLCDPFVVGGLARYSQVLAWLTPGSDHWRTLGLGITFELKEAPGWLERLTAAHAEAAAGEPGVSLKLYLARHLVELIVDGASADPGPREEPRICRQVFTILSPVETIRSRLAEQPDFALEEAGEGAVAGDWMFRWRDPDGVRESSGAPAGEVPLDPLVFLQEGALVLSSAVGEQSSAIRRRIETLLEGQVAFQKATEIDLNELARRMAHKKQFFEEVASEVFGKPAPASGAAPAEEAGRAAATGPGPGSAAVPQDIEAEVRRELESWRDAPAEVLEGKTVLEACRDPELRPRAILLVKWVLHGLDRQARQQGRAISLDWFVKQLGLDELT